MEINTEYRKTYEEYITHKQRAGCPYQSLKQIKRTLSLFYQYLIERHIENHRQIRKDDIKEFIRYLIDLTNDKGDKLYSSSSVNRRLFDLKVFLMWLSKRGASVSLAGYVKRIKHENHLSRNILSRKEIVRLFGIEAKTPAEFMMKTIFVILYGSGLRIGEVLSLRMEDINLETKEASFFETKTNKERTAQLGEAAASYLKLYLENIRDLLQKSPEKRRASRVFVSIREGKELRDNAVNENLKKFCRRAGIKKRITCHCFRHSFGTHLLENGAGIKEVSELLGHRDLKTTEKYTQLNPEHLRQTLLKYHPREKSE
jgi:integrase/recombinase XerD